MPSDLVIYATVGLAILLAGLNVRDLLRSPGDQTRLLAALMFSTLGLAMLIAANMSTVFRIDFQVLAAAYLALAKPFLLLQIIRQFRPVPRWIGQAVLGGLILALASSTMVIIALWGRDFDLRTATLPVEPWMLPTVMFQSFYFIATELYAAVALVQGALAASGVSRRRYRLAAGGSLILAGASVFDMVATLFVSSLGDASLQEDLIAITWGLFGLGLLSYYFGFTPPGWLQRAWQAQELLQFLQGGAGRSSGERAAETLAALCPAALSAVGGVAAVIATPDGEGSRLGIRIATEDRWKGERLSLAEGAPARAWRDRLALYARSRADFGAAAALADAADARALLIAPIAGERRAHGLLIVFLRRGTLFPADDQALLTLLADQTAVALDNAALVEEQRDLAAQLRETNADLERANRAKSEFLANMSHELRTPLNSIIGFSEILLDPEMPVDDETRTQFVQNTLQSGRHLLNLISDILDLSKVEAGRTEFYPEEFHLGQALEGVHAVIRPLALKKQQYLSLAVDPALDLVTHDPSRFKQVLFNLLSNAVKFTPEGGRIETRAALAAEDWMVIAVHDSGIGIRPEDREKIFEEFRQVDSGYGRKQQGTGLGLALVRRFVRLMGGEVEVESEPEVGSTFTVRLPLRHVGAPGGAERE